MADKEEATPKCPKCGGEMFVCIPGKVWRCRKGLCDGRVAK